MFTGIVSAVGTVRERKEEAARVRLEFSAPYEGLEPGESVAVNGACLTVVDRGPGWFAIEAVVTTRERTTLGELQVGDRVNLERALAVGDRLGGHWVLGHVDGVGTVLAVAEREDALLVDIEIPADVDEITVEHGSITIDGVSLTVNAQPAPGIVQVSLIPYTRECTTFDALRIGRRVHVEGDVLGKFVRRLTVARDETA